jgi:radical SAM-linked protein
MIRMRMQFMKTGAIRYTSHLDAMRMFQRGFKASGLPVSYSQGFHPHPRMSFGPPLKTGWEGLDEYFDCYFDKAAGDVVEQCNRHLPEGLRLTGSAVIPAELKKLPVAIAAARFSVQIRLAQPDNPAGGTAPPVIEPLRPFEMEFGSADTDGPTVLDMALREEDLTLTLEYTSTMKGGQCLSPEKIARDLLAVSDSSAYPQRVARTKLFVKIDHTFVSPLEEGEHGSRGNCN